MKIFCCENSADQLTHQTRKLLQTTLSQFWGISKDIGFSLRSSTDPKLVISGGHMCGVHMLNNLPDPGSQSYHIGGVARDMNGALVKAAGETHERYSQMISEFVVSSGDKIFASYNELQTRGEPLLDFRHIDLFCPSQYSKQEFPFDFVKKTDSLGWVKFKNVIDGSLVWVPAQLSFLGYKPRRSQGEPVFGPSVTTGTAVHPDPKKAMLSAILELIQIDTAMGHWYGNSIAFRIQEDSRIRNLTKWLNQTLPKGRNRPEFYWLNNKRLPGFYIACIFRNQLIRPKFSIGLGASMTLEDALQKSFLEASGVNSLATVLCEDQTKDQSDHFYDLDANVAYYANGANEELLSEKFDVDQMIPSAELPSDFTGSDAQAIKKIHESFLQHNLNLLFYDLTSVEARVSKLFVPRFWSPDLISLCLPSAPPKKHPGIKRYGGFQNLQPHPYP